MSITGIGPGDPQAPTTLTVQQGRSDFSSLPSALESGDLGGAQKVFGSLLQDILGPQSAATSVDASGSLVGLTPRMRPLIRIHLRAIDLPAALWSTGAVRDDSTGPGPA